MTIYSVVNIAGDIAGMFTNIDSANVAQSIMLARFVGEKWFVRSETAHNDTAEWIQAGCHEYEQTTD